MLLLEASRFITDTTMRRLVRQWIRTPVQELDGRIWCPIRGVPQGSPLSPLLANLYLDWFDEQLLQQDKRLVRFADDFLILCRTKQDAEHSLELTGELLAAMDLQLSQEKTRITSFEKGFRFLGVRFLRSLVMRSRVEDSELLVDHTPQPVASEPEQPERAEIIPPPLNARKPLLRTLYVTGYGARLSHEGESIILHPKGQAVQRIPMKRLDQIMIFGNLEITLPFIKTCLRQELPLSLHTANGRLYGVIDRRMGGNIERQKQQFQAADDPPRCVALAKAVLHAKISNLRVVMARYARNHPLPAFDAAHRPLGHSLQQLEHGDTLETLRGIEGHAGQVQFQAWRHSFETAWGFEGRRKRPAPDPINALLSFGYTLLYQNVQAFVRLLGLHPGVGFLHRAYPGHSALASDLMEEFRAPVVDAVVLNLLLNGKLRPDDFSTDLEQGRCRIDAQARAVFIAAFEKKMNSSFVHPVTGRQTDYRRCINQQVKAFCAWLEGNAHAYQAFYIR